MEINNSTICAECGFVSKAHPPAHIGICAGGWNAGDLTTGKQDVELFFSRALNMLDSHVLQVRMIYLTPDMSFILATANRLNVTRYGWKVLQLDFQPFLD